MPSLCAEYIGSLAYGYLLCVELFEVTQCYNDLCIVLVVVCKENKTDYYHRFVSVFIKTYGVMSQFIKNIWCNVTINQKYSKTVMMSSTFAPVVLNCSYSYTGPFISTSHTLQSYHTSFHHATHNCHIAVLLCVSMVCTVNLLT